MHGLPQSLGSQQAVDGAHWPDHARLCPDPNADAQGSGAGSGVADETQARLARIVEARIIPRLVRAHQRDVSATVAAAPRGTADGTVPGDEAGCLVELVLAGDIVCAVRRVEALCWSGASLEALCTDVLAPAARRLGSLWIEDRRDFAEVTMALWRLQQLLRELGPQFPSKKASRVSGLRALLVPAPGEDHSLGLAVAMADFAGAGWRVTCDPPASVDRLRETVGLDWFDVAGLAIGSETRVRTLAQSIDALRKSSRNPYIRVLIGGPLLVDRPGLVEVVGADGPMNDGRHAPARDEPLQALLAGAKCG